MSGFPIHPAPGELKNLKKCVIIYRRSSLPLVMVKSCMLRLSGQLICPSPPPMAPVRSRWRSSSTRIPNKPTSVGDLHRLGGALCLSLNEVNIHKKRVIII